MDELDLSKESTRPKSKAWIAWVGVGVALLISVGLLFKVKESLTQQAPDAGMPDSGAALVDAGEVAQLPPEEGDALLRKLAEDNPGSSPLREWLSAPGILQRIAAGVRLIARGESPRPVLGFIEFNERFVVIEKQQKKRRRKRRRRRRREVIERIYISPDAYARYDALVERFTSIDPLYLAQSYTRLRPYFDSAYAQVAGPKERFDDVLIEALETIILVKPQTGTDGKGGKIELVEKGAIYVFKDPALESLSAIEKQMLRMGPKNLSAVQRTLRSFAKHAKLKLEALEGQ